MSKQFWAVIAVIVLIFVGIVAMGGSDSKSGGSSSTKGLTQHVQGAGTGGVTLLEYGDYQCPFCQQYYPILKQVQANYGDQIKFQFRNFPLTSLHRNAFAGARAAEAADQQGKFWEMHDILYENSDPTGASGWVASKSPMTFFEQFAAQIGLNVAKFKTDFASPQINTAINADLAEANRLKLTGTPTFFVNGKKTDFTNSVESFKKVIDAELAKQNKPANQ